MDNPIASMNEGDADILALILQHQILERTGHAPSAIEIYKIIKEMWRMGEKPPSKSPTP